MVRTPTRIMALFLMVLLGLALAAGISWIDLVNDALVKVAMSGLLVLSLVPMMRAGVGLNFGMPIGVTAGLLGLCLAMNANLRGGVGFVGALAGALVLGVCFGMPYGKLLNVARGREEILGVFLGYTFLPLMSLFWTLAPFTNRKLLYPVGGQGMRPRIGLEPFFPQVLNRAWEFSLGPVTVPWGLWLVLGVIFALVAVLYRTAWGRSLALAGENEAYARLMGLPVERCRLFSTILSTVLAALGVCVYAQSYGFVELYEAASAMTFPAVCALLIGGAGPGGVRVRHALVGVTLYQTMYLLSTPVANAYIASETTELFRMIVTNGVILYAFLQRR